MVTLPKEFVATKYPGYFWNIKDNQLYSIKVTGCLKPLAKQKPNFFNHHRTGFCISVNGQKRLLDMEYLRKLKPSTTVFPVYSAQLELL